MLDNSWEKSINFVRELSSTVLDAYKQIMARRKDHAYTEKNMEWKKVRRGRYVEYNLVIDRGTKFGFNTPNARMESILISMPLEARWEYMHKVEEGSEEDVLLKCVSGKPRYWVSLQ